LKRLDLEIDQVMRYRSYILFYVVLS